MNELEFKELVEKVGKEAAEKIKAAMDEAKKGLVSKEDFDTAIKGLSIDAKSIKIGESNLDEIMRKQGDALAKLLAGDAGAQKMTASQIIEKHMGDAEKVFTSKQGVVTIELKAAAIMSTTNTIDDSTHSVPADLIESFSVAAFAGKRYGTQYIGAIADVTTVQNMEERTTWLEEGDEQGAFAVVEEGALKPLVSTSLVRNFATAKKIAGKYVITEEFAKFRANAYNIIRRLIMDKMVRDYSAILTTDLNAEAAGYTGTTLDGTFTNPNDYDAIGAVAAQIQSLNFNPDVLILNPQDAWRIRLTKNTEGLYVFPVVTQNGETRIFEFRLIVSTYQTAGYFTLGESGLFKVEEEPISIRMGYGITVTGSNPVTDVSSDFDNNRMRIIVETWIKDWLATPHVGSFVRAQFSTVKTALQEA